MPIRPPGAAAVHPAFLSCWVQNSPSPAVVWPSRIRSTLTKSAPIC